MSCEYKKKVIRLQVVAPIDKTQVYNVISSIKHKNIRKIITIIA